LRIIGRVIAPSHVVNLTGGSTLRARVAVGERMLAVTADFQDLVAGNFGESPHWTMQIRQYVRLLLHRLAGHVTPHHTVAIGVAGEPTIPGSRSGGP